MTTTHADKLRTTTSEIAQTALLFIYNTVKFELVLSQSHLTTLSLLSQVKETAMLQCDL